MAITFNQIPARLRTPGVYIETSAKLLATGERINTVLHVGYKTASGTAELNRIHQVNRLSESRSLFGADSLLAGMAKPHTSYNKGLTLYQVCIEPPETETRAEGHIQINESASKSSVYSVRIADQLVQVAIAENDGAAAIAVKLKDAITANTEASRYVAASVETDRVDLVSKVPGQLGNNIPLVLGYYDEEINSVSSTVLAISGGSGKPDIQAALDAMGEDFYDYIVNPFIDADNLRKLDDALLARWDAMAANNIETIAVMATRGDLNATIAKGKSLNSEFFSVIGTGLSPDAPWLWSATLAAIASDSLTNDPSQSIVTDELPGLKAPQVCWTQKERNELLYSGITTFTSSPDRHVFIEKMITTYQVDEQGYPDWSYLSIHVPELMRNIRRVQRALLATTFRKYKIADKPELYGGGQKITSEAEVKGYLHSIYREELMIKRAWCVGYDAYIDSVVVERNPDNRSRIDYKDNPVMIAQLDILAGHSELHHG